MQHLGGSNGGNDGSSGGDSGGSSYCSAGGCSSSSDANKVCSNHRSCTRWSSGVVMLTSMEIEIVVVMVTIVMVEAADAMSR